MIPRRLRMQEQIDCRERSRLAFVRGTKWGKSIGYLTALNNANEAIKEMCYQYPFIWPTDNASMQALDEIIANLKERRNELY